MSEVSFAHFKALVVEDNDFVRFMIKKHLTEFGFKAVYEASNGMEGIEKLEEQPDIVLCDINMEPLNGFEFLKLLRKKDNALSRLPVIFLTSNADASYVQKAIDLQVDAYLIKPVMPDMLKKKIITIMTKAMTG